MRQEAVVKKDGLVELCTEHAMSRGKRRSSHGRLDMSLQIPQGDERTSLKDPCSPGVYLDYN